MTPDSTTTGAKTRTGTSGRFVILTGVAVLAFFAIPLLLAGRGEERFVDLRSLRQVELSSWRVGSFHLTAIEVEELDAWPVEDAHPHALRSGLGTPLRATPSAYWNDLLTEIDDDPREPLWHATYRLLPMAIIVPIVNRRPMTTDARGQLDLRIIMVSVLDPSIPEHRDAYWQLDAQLSRGVRVFDPLDPPRGRVGYIAPVEGEIFARELLSQILDAAHASPSEAPTIAREILMSAAQQEPRA